MRLLYETELRPYVDNKNKDEIISYATELIATKNAINWQKVNELSFLLRRSNRKDEAVEISKRMFEAEPSLDKLNLYFVAVIDQGDFDAIRYLSDYVANYLKVNNLTYQKHLYATWLKAANRITDDELFERIYSTVPSEEKISNTYIISQYYVNCNRRSMYKEVKEHYEKKLPPHIQNAKYVQQYYLNACQRLGYNVKKTPLDSTYTVDSSPVAPIEDEDDIIAGKTAFLVYSGEPDYLVRTKEWLGRNNIKFIDLAQTTTTSETIIEAFEKQAQRSDIAIVLLTHDERFKKDERYFLNPNVALECGFFYGYLGRDHVVNLNKDFDKTELPSDMEGIRYIDLNDWEWMFKLNDALKQAGFSVNSNL